MQSAIIIDSLKKTYVQKARFTPEVRINALDLSGRVEIPRGELFGLIGPDGAGKTTLFRLLATLLTPDAGSATVEGFDIVREYKKIRTITGYMPGRFSLYPDLSVKENLQFYADVFGMDIQKNYALIEDIYCRLKPFEGRKVGKLSGGMKQKLALCCSLIHAPRVLLLDEPTTGVDPSSRREFWDALTRLRAGGMTIVVSTAYMDEATRCDRVAMMQDGHFLTIDSPDNIIENFEGTLIAVRSDEMFRLLRDLRDMAQVKACYTFGENHHLLLTNEAAKTGLQATVERLSAELIEKYGHKNVVVAPCKATMEDCYMYLAGITS